MAFVAILPAVGSTVLPALGSLGTGLGGMLGGLGGMASGIPLLGGPMSGLLGGAGQMLGGLGGGLSGLGAGGGMGALTGGLKGMYGGADKMLGGFLPNIPGAGIDPAMGMFGQSGLNILGNSPIFGGPAPQAINPFTEQALMDAKATNELVSKGFMDAPAGFTPFDGIMPGAGGRPDGFGGVVHDMKQAGQAVKDQVDPILGPVTKFGVELGKGMDFLNMGAGGPQPGATQTPAQAAQNAQYTPITPIIKQPTQAPQSVQLVPGSTQGAPQAFVPVSSGVSAEDNKELSEEELRQLVELYGGTGNFLQGVAQRSAVG